MKIKVCGLKHYQNIKSISELDIDFIGLIFYKKSQRYINQNLSFDEVRAIPNSVKKVGVFVDEDDYAIINTIAHFELDYVQLHGNESPETCKELKKYAGVIKAFGLSDSFNFELLNEYQGLVDYFLFDTATESKGGSGKIFNWEILKKYKLNIPFFLSGGISTAHIADIETIKHPQLIGLDVNSKFEIEPGLKDAEQVKEFIQHIKN